MGQTKGTIKNHGKQIAKGKSDSHGPMNISLEFDVANVSKPLGSVSKMVKKAHKNVFDEPTSFIQNKNNGKKISLRSTGLNFLDLWVQMPTDLEIPYRFVKPVK